LIFAFFGWLIMSILEWVFRFVDVVDIGCVSIHDVYSRILCVERFKYGDDEEDFAIDC